MDVVLLVNVLFLFMFLFKFESEVWNSFEQLKLQNIAMETTNDDVIPLKRA